MTAEADTADLPTRDLDAVQGQAPTRDRRDRRELGVIQIKENVVAKLAAYLATEVPDIGGRAELHRRPAVSARVDGGQAYLDVTASVRWPASVGQVTADLRQHLRTRVRELTGLEVGEIRIEVSDLITAAPHARVS
ncbi:putative alkaline shock family protein YloU [Hamadaea flava]|uniref:Asp23/Gls24 family envelope stress response protein n=1 Tax=Hamadaea flava TaxID=1742688 RepID=A0ABV8LRQ0_9ACTN|nr:Asp23/Gls24 family envelope stress response protein [Hamadaea flava]MCP2322935.1 putative alkaline shock family protein YloU [Hamadaea flava]